MRFFCAFLCIKAFEVEEEAVYFQCYHIALHSFIGTRVALDACSNTSEFLNVNQHKECILMANSRYTSSPESPQQHLASRYSRSLTVTSCQTHSGSPVISSHLIARRPSRSPPSRSTASLKRPPSPAVGGAAGTSKRRGYCGVTMHWSRGRYHPTEQKDFDIQLRLPMLA